MRRHCVLPRLSRGDIPEREYFEELLDELVEMVIQYENDDTVFYENDFATVGVALNVEKIPEELTFLRKATRRRERQ